MVKIEILMQEGKVSRINELEFERYLNFFEHSSNDNFQHSLSVANTFPRWSIISGYYAMHDRTKLFIAKMFRLKIELEVHSTTIKVLQEVLRDREILQLMEKGYHEFIAMANDLAEAKKERVKSQYYTGSAYMKQEYKQRAAVFLHEIVEPFLHKINQLMESKHD
ncbi:TPA: hypothetical protein HA242_04345 [Candidatus Woesearchaeota archaeon]|nr:hypothetical protein [Candidatus Woesearchaeota archaeon]HIH12929.1 hypothetical protein [Candidatus Woesearchaeota archaeon]